MTQIEKLVARLLTCPNTFRFHDFVRVMESFGFKLDQKGTTSGSRVRFYRERDGRVFIMHSPHPSDEMTRGAIRAASRFLKTEVNQ